MQISTINNKNIHAFLCRSHFLDFIEDKHKILIALNAEKLLKDEAKMNNLINMNIGYADGIGAVLALRRKGVDAIKIPGAEFWLDIIERFEKNKSVYLLGSSEQVIQETVARLMQDYPDLKIKGYRNGYFKDKEQALILDEIKTLAPKIVFVALGSPRQEFLMAEFIQEYPALYMGLGGSFDVYSGSKKRAPRIFIRLGLEWLYRLIKEPARIRRQLNLGVFFLRIVFGNI